MPTVRNIPHSEHIRYRPIEYYRNGEDNTDDATEEDRPEPAETTHYKYQYECNSAERAKLISIK